MVEVAARLFQLRYKVFNKVYSILKMPRIKSFQRKSERCRRLFFANILLYIRYHFAPKTEWLLKEVERLQDEAIDGVRESFAKQVRIMKGAMCQVLQQ